MDMYQEEKTMNKTYETKNLINYGKHPLDGEIIKIMPGAMFVRIQNGEDVLCPIPWNREPYIGDKVKVVVTNVKSRNRPGFPSIGLRGHITYNNGGNSKCILNN